MELEGYLGLDRKSRGILFRMKQLLESKKLPLKDYICKVFGYFKHEYNKKQLTKLIRNHDKQLALAEIDHLFDELDEGRNGKVFYYRLSELYDSLGAQDDPHAIDRSKVISTASRSKRKRKEESLQEVVKVLQQVRGFFSKSDDLVEIVHLLAAENEGSLSKGNLVDLLNNLDYNTESKRDTFLECILEGKQMVPLSQFLQKIDLQSQARRSIVSLPSKSRLPAPELQQSTFIKEHKRESRLQESMLASLSISQRNSSDGNDYIDIEKVPATLTPYFNYGSQLEASFATLSEDYLKHKAIFIDPENPPYSQASRWVHMTQVADSYQLFEVARSVVQRQKGRKGLGRMLQPKDIIQGSLGDCYFLSAVAGVVEKYPELVYRLFVLERNPSHIYGVRLFIEGEWVTVLVDACFPVNHRGVFCAAQPHHSQIWVMMLEKAWAKVYGSYDNIHAGYNDEGLNAMSGAPSVYVSAQENQFVRRVEVELNKGSIITCATSSHAGQLTKSQQQQLGIFASHAYSLLSIHRNLPWRDNQITLLKVRNPWGRKAWQGKWAFHSQQWTQALRQILDYRQNPNDGTFFISQQDFTVYFDCVHICRVNLANKNSWTRVDSEREEFKGIRLRVKAKGDYHFSIYQENPRRHSGRPYQKSKSWLFLGAEEEGGRIRAIGSSSKERRDNTVEVTLEKGVYVIAAKVQWRFWEKHPFTLSSYGPERVTFAHMASFNIHILSDFIESKARLGLGKKSFYDDRNIMKRVLFSPDEGYGFILVSNQQSHIFELTIRFDQYRGLTILPPYNLPIKLEIFPGEEVICKFLVDPMGYSYALKQSYKYRHH